MKTNPLLAHDSSCHSLSVCLQRLKEREKKNQQLHRLQTFSGETKIPSYRTGECALLLLPIIFALFVFIYIYNGGLYQQTAFDRRYFANQNLAEFIIRQTQFGKLQFAEHKFVISIGTAYNSSLVTFLLRGGRGRN